MQNFNDVCLLIPAYKPDPVLIALVAQLREHHFTNIVIVDDGSGKKHQKIFSKLADCSEVTVLTHKENKGKGAALKTGLEFIKKYLPESLLGVITVDADGQHKLEDIKKVSLSLREHPHQFVLGVRAFDEDVPLRSKFGNVLTKVIFKFLYRQEIKDTQTGLRAIPMKFLERFLNLESGRYEYELECLIYAARADIPIEQVDIETVYLDDNQSSHFNPIIDSLRIYFVLFRFMLVSFLSFLIDISVFAVCHYTVFNIFLSLLIARIISGIFNFYNNKIRVYKSLSKQRFIQELISYVVLMVVIFFVSFLAISYLVHHWGWNAVAAKVMVDALLFVMSFIVQRHFVFRF